MISKGGINDIQGWYSEGFSTHTQKKRRLSGFNENHLPKTGQNYTKC